MVFKKLTMFSPEDLNLQQFASFSLWRPRLIRGYKGFRVKRAAHRQKGEVVEELSLIFVSIIGNVLLTSVGNADHHLPSMG